MNFNKQNLLICFFLILSVIASFYINLKLLSSNNSNVLNEVTNLGNFNSQEILIPSENLKSFQSSQREILINGSCCVEVELKNLNLIPNKRYRVEALVEITKPAYRSYVTILLNKLEKKNKKEKILQVANSDDALWEGSKNKTISLEFVMDNELYGKSLKIMGYDRDSLDNLNKISFMTWKIKKFQIYEVENNNNKNLLIASALFFLVGIFSFYSSYIRLPEDTSVTKRHFVLMRISLFLSVVLVLLSVGTLDVLPTFHALRLRADAWSYDIVARSISSGYGFKAYNITELTSYPLVPIFYSFVYLVFGVKTTTVFFSNLFILLATLASIAFYDFKFNKKRLLFLLIIFIFWSPLWTSLSWTLSETLSMFILCWVVISVAYLIQAKNHIFIRNIFIGFLLGISALIRTDFYGLLGIVIFYILLKLKKRSFLPIFILLVTFIITIAPWIAFQQNNEKHSSHQTYWNSDIERVKVISNNFLSGRNLKGEESLKDHQFFKNFTNMVLRPYNTYVDEAKIFRASYMNFFNRLIHLAIIFLLCFLIFNFYKNQNKNPENNIETELINIILIITISRTFILCLLHDSPRYFSHQSGILAMLLLIFIQNFNLSGRSKLNEKIKKKLF